MSSLSFSLGFIDLKGLFSWRGKEGTLYATQKAYSSVVEGNAGELIGGLKAPETADIPLEIPGQIVEVVKPLWKICHADPANHFLLAIAIVLLAAKLGEVAARRLGDPGITGELLVGVLLGNVWLFSGWRFFDFLREMHFLEILGELGAVVLLLMIGLHTDLRAMLKTGLSSFLVATGGALAPAGLGFLVAHFMLPGITLPAKLFLAVALCATSMAVKVRVLAELKMVNTVEGRIIIGAALVDDIIALMLLGVASGIALSGTISYIGLGITGGISILFLFVVAILSLKFHQAFGNFVTKRVPQSLRLGIVAAICLGLAFLAEFIGLHAIIGAFGAGLLLQKVKLEDLAGNECGLDWFVNVAYVVLVPIFFVLVGSKVSLESFFNLHAVLVGLAISGAAILGKMFCSVCVVERGVNRLAIGVAMIPRLEMGLVVATVGKSIGVLDDFLYSSIIVMVVITSIGGPNFLRMVLLMNQEKQKGKA